MHAQTQARRQFESVSQGLSHVRTVHHGTGGGNEPVQMRFADARRDALGVPIIIRVHDQLFLLHGVFRLILVVEIDRFRFSRKA